MVGIGLVVPPPLVLSVPEPVKFTVIRPVAPIPPLPTPVIVPVVPAYVPVPPVMTTVLCVEVVPPPRSDAGSVIVPVMVPPETVMVTGPVMAPVVKLMVADAVSVQLPMVVMVQLVEVKETPVPESVAVPATVKVVEMLAACAPAPNIAARASPNMLVVFMVCTDPPERNAVK